MKNIIAILTLLFASETFAQSSAENYQVGKQATASGKIVNTRKVMFGLLKGIALVTDDGTFVVCQSRGKYSNTEFNAFKKGDQYSCEGTVDEYDEIGGGFYVILEDRNLAAESEAKLEKELADKKEARGNELVLVQGSFTAFSVNDGPSEDVDHGEIACGISMVRMKSNFESQVGKANRTYSKIEKQYVREIWHSNNGLNKLSMTCYEPVFKKRSDLEKTD
ncbi:hypothetical protein N8075_04505 [Planktomarina temperata]|nr:hypothetical protein [Planktomarina temperata]